MLRGPLLRRIGRYALGSAVILLSQAGGARAIDHDVYKEIRGRYEGLAFRLRVDLAAARRALPPNTISLSGLGHDRENAPVLFGRLETVYVQRVTNESATRLELTVYRSREESDRLRASAAPQPMGGNPLAGRMLAGYAQMGSTSVLLDLQAGKKEPQAQESEVETLLRRLFYVGVEPGRDELEDFVRKHRGLAIGRLRELTGLPPERIRELIRESPDEAMPPPVPGPASPP